MDKCLKKETQSPLSMLYANLENGDRIINGQMSKRET